MSLVQLVALSSATCSPACSQRPAAHHLVPQTDFMVQPPFASRFQQNENARRRRNFVATLRRRKGRRKGWLTARTSHRDVDAARASRISLESVLNLEPWNL